MEQGIKFVITGDTKGLEDASSKADSALDKLNKKISQLQNDIAQNIRITQGYENAIEKLSREFQQGTISQDKYSKSLERLQRDEKETIIETQRLRKELSQLQRDQKSLVGASNAAASGIQDLGRRGGGATQTLSAFGGVIQDAPFGIRGVANNIEFLTQSFVHLQRSAGGTRQALKAVVGSLAGPAGILIAVSVVTATMNALSSSSLKLTDVLGFLSGETDDLAKAKRALAKASKESESSALAEVETVKALVGVLQDENSTREESLRAYNKINDLQPSVLEGLTLEAARTQDLTKNIDLLTASLIREAKIRGAQELIAKETAKILEAESKSVIDSANAWDFLVAGMSGATAASELTVRGAKRQGEAISESEERIKSLTDRLGELIGEDIKLEGFFTETGDTIKDGIEKRLKLEPIDLSGIKLSGMDKLAEQAAYIFSTQFGEKVKASDLTGDISITGEILTDANQLPTAGIDEYVAKMQQAHKSAEVASNGISAGFNAATQSIVKNLETGSAVFDAFIASVAGGLMDLLSQFVQFQLQKSILAKKDIATNQAKATSSAIVAGAETAASSGPLAAFVLPAIIAGAIAVIAGAFGGIKFAQGGAIGGGSFTGDKVPILANSGEYVLTAQDQGYLTNFLRGNVGGTQNTGGAVTVTGRIEAEGSKLVTVISNAQRRSNRLGGSMKL